VPRKQGFPRLALEGEGFWRGPWTTGGARAATVGKEKREQFQRRASHDVGKMNSPHYTKKRGKKNFHLLERGVNGGLSCPPLLIKEKRKG